MSRAQPPYPPILAREEWEVLALIANGDTDDEIASRLGISAPRVRFHTTEILGRLRLSSREQAAEWYRERYPRAPFWGPLVGWLRTPSNASRLLGASVVVLVAIAVVIAAWGVAHPSRTPGPVPVPVAVQAPDDLVNASWANDGEWIFAFDLRTNRQTIVDRSFREVARLPAGTVPAPTGDSRVGATGVLSSAYANYASLSDSRVITAYDPHNVVVWDAATGEVLEELIRAWDLPNFTYTFLDGSYRTALGLPDRVTDFEPWFDRVIAIDGSTVTVWDRTGKMLELGGIERARTDATITSVGLIGFNGQGEPDRSRDQPAPSASLMKDQCGIWLSPSGRLAVVHAGVSSEARPAEGIPPDCGAGRCLLVDVTKNTVGDEWNVSSRDQVVSESCDAVSWSPDEREILFSSFGGV